MDRENEAEDEAISEYVLDSITDDDGVLRAAFMSRDIYHHEGKWLTFHSEDLTLQTPHMSLRVEVCSGFKQALKPRQRHSTWRERDARDRQRQPTTGRSGFR